ncbi:MAG: hypothetical protein F6J92_21345 [Symploca sp. SIO1A3]|nr:hypothetical protein [Symploca sp. SIO1A3]
MKKKTLRKNLLPNKQNTPVIRPTKITLPLLTEEELELLAGGCGHISGLFDIVTFDNGA